MPLRIATAEGHGHRAGTQTPQEGLLANQRKWRSKVFDVVLWCLMMFIMMFNGVLMAFFLSFMVFDLLVFNSFNGDYIIVFSGVYNVV